MLDTLAIKNFAIIEDIEVNFQNGMNVLLGETGAGKSIIIEALSLLKGERSSFDKIRTGANKAFIEGRFLLENQELIDELNAEYDNFIEDGELIVTRILDTTGRNTIRLNGRMFSQAATKVIMCEILDIHSQHQNMTLYDEKSHIELLDKYIGENKFLTIYKENYKKYKDELKKLEKLQDTVIDEASIEYKKKQIEEIDEMDIQVGELEKLENIQKKMANFIRLQTILNNVDELLDGDDGACSRVYQARREIDTVQDSDFEKLSDRLNNAFYELQDVNSQLRSYVDEINEYEYSSDYLNERIYKLKKIIRKYGDNEEDVINAKAKLTNEILLADDYNYYLKKQQEEVDNCLKELTSIANELTKVRQDKALELEKLVDKQLFDLSLGNAHFKIEIKNSEFSSNGKDHIRFLLSANVGTPFMPLKNIVSGGESSRLMLGLKTIFTSYSHLETIIFDEVDVGVSGKVATQVGKKIHDISQNRQVITISHLPQVASYGDHAYSVHKYVENDMTKTTIIPLEMEQFISQVAMLLSGSEITNSSLQVARELITSSHK